MSRNPKVYMLNASTLPSFDDIDGEDTPTQTDREYMVEFTRAFAAAQQSPSWGYVLDYLRVLGELGIHAHNMGLDMFQRCVQAAEAKMEEAVKDRPPPPEPNTKGHDSVVYYMKLGDLVKIGISKRIAQRVMAFNPQRVLAVEPGSHALETVRHHQFTELHEHGEWFRYEQPLKEHIRQLPERFKQGTGIEMNDWLAEHLQVRYLKKVVPFGLEEEEQA